MKEGLPGGTLRLSPIGRVELVCSDGQAPPKIIANFYDHPEDLARVVDGVKRVRSLFEHPALALFVTEEVFPGAGLVDDGAVASAMQGAPTTEAHPIGTCSIGPARSSWASWTRAARCTASKTSMSSTHRSRRRCPDLLRGSIAARPGATHSGRRVSGSSGRVVLACVRRGG
jgi:hypothetical protein